MLTLTEHAVDAIRTLIAQPGLSEDAGLRIAHQDQAGALALSLSPGPETGDEIIEIDGARVFLQADAAAMLKDSALSARIDDHEGVIFQIDE